MNDDVVSDILGRCSLEEMSWHDLLRLVATSDQYACGDVRLALGSVRMMLAGSPEFMLGLATLAMLDVVVDCDDPAWERSWSVIADRACVPPTREEYECRSSRFAVISSIRALVPFITDTATADEVWDAIRWAVTRLADDVVFDGVGAVGSVTRLFEATMGLHVACLEFSQEMKKVGS